MRLGATKHRNKVLKQIKHKKKTFMGTFMRYSQSRGAKVFQTALVKYIHTDASTQILFDHVWFQGEEVEPFRELDLRKGDKIEFKARVRKYYKGIFHQVNYKLGKPSNLKKVDKEKDVNRRTKL